MRQLKPALKSIYGLLSQAGAKARQVLELRTENVRKAMLEATPVGASGEQHPEVFRRIYYAGDIETLWYTRGELMAALSAERGEKFAQQAMAGILKLFEGLLPEARGQGRARGIR